MNIGDILEFKDSYNNTMVAGWKAVELLKTGVHIGSFNSLTRDISSVVFLGKEKLNGNIKYLLCLVVFKVDLSSRVCFVWNKYFDL